MAHQGRIRSPNIGSVVTRCLAIRPQLNAVLYFLFFLGLLQSYRWRLPKCLGIVQGRNADGVVASFTVRKIAPRRGDFKFHSARFPDAVSALNMPMVNGMARLHYPGEMTVRA